MPIVQSLNQKANVKKLTTNDLPFAPAQPVISSYYGTSTAGQTSIANLGFSVDTVNNPDIFFLFVDGKKLTLGSSNDFVFAAVAADGTSSSITLNQALPSGLNIQAYKLGLKKESEFLTDNRFTQLYEAESQGFQGFVNTQSKLLTATATAGTPAAGTFYSSIVGRAAITDITQDLRASFGIERVMAQNVYQLQTEVGPNGEPVWSVSNDDRGLIRLVGAAVPLIDGYGPRGLRVLDNTSYIEITFYGTGLNILTLGDGAARTYQYAVDGGALTTYQSAAISGVLGNRNYDSNLVFQVVSGLALGVHTVKLLNSAGSSLELYGFEVINAASATNVTVNPGTAYVGGQKLVNSAIQTFAYNSVATGTKGGRTVVYQNANGSIGQAFQAVNSAIAYLSAADHTSEEAVRTYNYREFGASRNPTATQDDFSGNFSNSSLAFTLDDGTTTLSGTNLYVTSAAAVFNYLQVSGTLTLAFVGTGLDVWYLEDRNAATLGTGTVQFAIDGGALQNWPVGINNSGTSSATLRQVKVVSGLPYGTHTFKWTTNGLQGFNGLFSKFVVYQPKKPAIPSGAIELADYNVMATFAANATAGLETVSTGVLRKEVSLREATYVDGTGGTTSWTAGLSLSNSVGGWEAYTDRSGAYLEYTFYGTGFDFRWLGATNRSANISVTVDGLALTTANFPALSASTYGGGGFSAGTLNQSTASNVNGLGFVVTGLPLAPHKVRFTNNTASSYLVSEAFDIITPIHSVKSNLVADLQNSLPVGSCSISDNRRTTPVKDSLPAQKAWAQAVGVASGPTTTSTSFVPMPDMSVTIKTNGGPLDILFAARLDTTGIVIGTQIYVDGVAVGVQINPFNSSTGTFGLTVANTAIVPVGPGVHKVDVYWTVNSGTGTASGTQRILKVQEK